MRIIIIASCLLLLSHLGADAQIRRDNSNVVAASTVLSDKHTAASQRAVVYRNRAQRANRTNARSRLNQELQLTKQANASMRKAREAIAAKEIIRKEKSKLYHEGCGTKYNSYVQHQSYAYDHPTNHQDSILLHRDELVVLLKKKKYHFKLCIDGSSYYVLREAK